LFTANKRHKFPLSVSAVAVSVLRQISPDLFSQTCSQGKDRTMPQSPSLTHLGLAALQALGRVWQRGWRLTLLCFALGVAVDLALSPYLLRWLSPNASHGAALVYGPTLLAWWLLTPLLLAHSLAAQLRPATLHKALDSLTTPPPGTGALWWCGPLSWWTACSPLLALLIWVMPEWASWKYSAPWVLASWGLAVLLMVPLALVPAAVVDGTPNALRTAWKAGISLTLKISALAGFGGAISFVLGHSVIGLVFLPLAQGASDPRRSIGILLIVLGNLFMALAVPMMSVAGGSGWQIARRHAWERAQATHPATG
jgi:hypothetical protein